MSDQSVELDRIERALARIDAACRQRTSALAKVELRHARLREEVEGSLAALDALIAANAAGSAGESHNG